MDSLIAPIGFASLAIMVVAAGAGAWARDARTRKRRRRVDESRRSPSVPPAPGTGTPIQVAKTEVVPQPRTVADAKVAMAAAQSPLAGAAPAVDGGPDPLLQFGGPRWAETEPMSGLGIEAQFAETTLTEPQFAETTLTEAQFAETMPAEMNFADTLPMQCVVDERPRLAAGRVRRSA